MSRINTPETENTTMPQNGAQASPSLISKEGTQALEELRKRLFIAREEAQKHIAVANETIHVHMGRIEELNERIHAVTRDLHIAGTATYDNTGRPAKYKPDSFA